MKKTLALILALAMSLSLAACGGKNTASADTNSGDSSSTADDGVKTITIGVASDLQSFDPANNDSTASECILHNIFSHLYTQTADGETIPDLAESYEILDNTTWQFKLKEGVTFSNGDKLTAEDVKFSLERPATDTGLRENQYFNVIAGVDVVDDTTLNIRTNDPYPALMSLVSKAGSEILPKSYVESCGGMDEFQKAPIGSGPYKFVSWSKDDSVVLEKNETYFETQMSAEILTRSSTR